MNSIGGYFELELALGTKQYHSTSYAFKSARSSLRFILNLTRPSFVYIPFYTCDALLEPFLETNTKYAFYQINQALHPGSIPELKEGEYFLYPNYLGLNSETVLGLSEKFKDKLIVDCAQAFFMKGNGKSWFFNSCRKFFGVPDGSYLYVPRHIGDHQVYDRNEIYNVDHLLKRFNGHPEDGYASFLENERLCGGEIKAMSRLTEHILSTLDYEDVITKRRNNFSHLHEIFRDVNLMEIVLDETDVPMAYPLLLKKELTRSMLYENRVFIPTFWRDVLTRNNDGFDTEKYLVNKLYPLPIDQRYNMKDLDRMISIIKSAQ